MGPTTIQMHWFLGTTKIPMDSNRSTFRKRKTLCPNIDQTLVILAFNQLLKACCLRTPVASWFTPPPKKKKKARPGGSTHTQTNKSFDQACHVWVTGQKSELHKKCYISAHARLTSTGTENLKDIRSSSSRKPWETYGDWTIYTVPPLSTKTRPSKWKLFPLAKKGENKTYSKHYDLYIGAC